MWWAIGGLAFYAAGFAFVLYAHAKMMPNVTPGLAFLRSAVWPYYLLTGRPKGRPLPMD